MIDLSGGKLRLAELGRFTRCQRLVLDNNALGLRAMAQSGIFSLPALDDVSLSFNKFKKMESLAYIANRLGRVRVLNISNCKAFDADTKENR